MSDNKHALAMIDSLKPSRIIDLADATTSTVEGSMIKEYNAPKLVKIGSFEEVTKGNRTGASLDMAFPVGTPGADLRFS